ncbi:MAG: large conductance mechanosensitive channel protein MscL [Clostridia bacterium]|nr:large conductance mechanosensitive channel protein MscL [Clostridia bacterium]
MKKFFKEFKDFISRGNILDMAIGVIIGGAFSAIVNSLVNDIIMPLLKLATGDGIQGLSVQLNTWVSATLEDGSANPAAIYWNYGNFIMAIVNFLIIAICLFIGIKIVMSIKKAGQSVAEKQKKAIAKKLKKGEITEEEAAQAVVETEAQAEPAAPVETPDDLLREIRDLLKANKEESKKDE